MKLKGDSSHCRNILGRRVALEIHCNHSSEYHCVEQMVWQGTVDIFRKYERYNAKVHLLNPFYQSFSFVFTLLFVCLVV